MARRAFDDIAAAIRRVGNLRGVVHSFSGSQEQANQFWKLGFHIGIGGPITYERAHRLRGIVRDMPLEFLLLETDSPDQPLCGHQGHRNEPAMLVEVCRTIAELRGADPARNRRRDDEELRTPFRAQLSALRSSSRSMTRAAATMPNVAVTCIAAPSPPLQSSLSPVSASGARVLHTVPSACG